MDFEVIWTDRASADLEAIFNYISEHNHSAARKVVQEVVDRVELLRTSPRMGKKYKRKSAADTRVIVSGKHRVYYNVLPDEQRVEILTVWHTARQEPKLPD